MCRSSRFGTGVRQTPRMGTVVGRDDALARLRAGLAARGPVPVRGERASPASCAPLPAARRGQPGRGRGLGGTQHLSPSTTTLS